MQATSPRKGKRKPSQPLGRTRVAQLSRPFSAACGAVGVWGGGLWIESVPCPCCAHAVSHVFVSSADPWNGGREFLISFFFFLNQGLIEVLCLFGSVHLERLPTCGCVPKYGDPSGFPFDFPLNRPHPQNPPTHSGHHWTPSFG